MSDSPCSLPIASLIPAFSRSLRPSNPPSSLPAGSLCPCMPGSTSSSSDVLTPLSIFPSPRLPVSLQAGQRIFIQRDPRLGFGFSLSGESPSFVHTVIPRGPADMGRDGLLPGDVIMKINDHPVAVVARSAVLKMIEVRHLRHHFNRFSRSFELTNAQHAPLDVRYFVAMPIGCGLALTS